MFEAIKKFLLISLGAFLSYAMFASVANAGAIEIQGAWAAATSDAKKTGSVFMTIVNNGAEDSIVKVKTPIAKMAQVHNSKQKGDRVSMRRQSSFTIPAGKMMFMPESDHIMLMKMKQPLAAGDSFPITIELEKAGEITAQVTVKMAGMADHKNH